MHGNSNIKKVISFMIQTFLHKNMQVTRVRVHTTSRKYLQWITISMKIQLIEFVVLHSPKMAPKSYIFFESKPCVKTYSNIPNRLDTWVLNPLKTKTNLHCI